jgi:hypothetical protein
VSAWGPALFCDDTACDVRDEYRALIEDGTDDAAAMRRILDSYADALEDPDDGPVVWLALAFTQSKIGRLDQNVAARALEIIDNHDGMSRWFEQGPKLEARRRAALAKVRAQLTGPQPARKKLRPPWRHVTTLQAGDVLAYHTTAGPYLLLRVARIDDNRNAAAPILVLLDFARPRIPRLARAARIPDRREPPRSYASIQQPWGITRFEVVVSKKSDPDYLDAGFQRIGSIASRSGDNSINAGHLYPSWPLFGQDLNDRMIAQPV